MGGVRMNDDEPKTIEHDPNERRGVDRVWWLLWPLISVFWLATWYFWGFDWHQIGLGAFTGMALASWAIEITGNKTPNWMR